MIPEMQGTRGNDATAATDTLKRWWAGIAPEWLRGMVPPTLALWLFTLAFGVGVGVGSIASAGRTRADAASSYALALVLSAWVLGDARKRGEALCYDYDTFVFLAWPVMVPVYLFRTRRWRALLSMLCFLGLYLVSVGVALALNVASNRF